MHLRYRYRLPDLTRQCGIGNSIYPLTGAKRQVVGIDIGGQLGAINIAYDTTPRLPSIDAAGVEYPAPSVSLGGLWSTEVHRRLVFHRNDVDEIVSVQAERGGNRWVTFTNTSSGFAPLPGDRDRLTRTSDGWIYIDGVNEALEVYDADGVLQRRMGLDGRTISFAYSTASTAAIIAPYSGLLVGIQDVFGRTAQLSYELATAIGGAARLKALSNGAGPVATFGYFDDNLSSVTWSDGTRLSYLYENPALPWALTGTVDELGNGQSTFAYDDLGRAVLTELATGLNRYSVTWASPPLLTFDGSTFDRSEGALIREYSFTLAGGTRFESPNGSVTLEEAVLINRIPKSRARSQPAGSGCAASTSQQSYDANGNVASRDDFNGTRACYANDLGRNLEILRVQGLNSTAVCSEVIDANAALPAGSRKISTQWHPHWRLETKTAEPGRITTKIYNGQPDPTNGNAIASCAPSTALLPNGRPIAVLCKQVEQATTDVNGALGFTAALQSGVADREQKWTYNQFGQVLTHDGPRTDVNDVTTYGYYADTTADHTVGDLASVTNALGKTTLFSKYNRQGQPLQSTDPNGVLTINTYDARQRLLTRSVDGQVTRFAYDPAGQLTRVTQPDSSYIGYEYDAAHRMTAMFDNLGNRVEYTLDNAGNRIAENVKDPSGVLRRSVSRSLDALGRVQQLVGRE